MHKSCIGQHFEYQRDVQEVLWRFINDVGARLVSIRRYLRKVLLSQGLPLVSIVRHDRCGVPRITLQISATVTHESEFIGGINRWVGRQNLLNQSGPGARLPDDKQRRRLGIT